MRAPPLLLLLLPLLLVLPEGPPTSSFSSIPSILITCTPHPSIRPAWFTILGSRPWCSPCSEPKEDARPLGACSWSSSGGHREPDRPRGIGHPTVGHGAPVHGAQEHSGIRAQIWAACHVLWLTRQCAQHPTTPAPHWGPPCHSWTGPACPPSLASSPAAAAHPAPQHHGAVCIWPLCGRVSQCPGPHSAPSTPQSAANAPVQAVHACESWCVAEQCRRGWHSAVVAPTCSSVRAFLWSTSTWEVDVKKPPGLYTQHARSSVDVPVLLRCRLFHPWG